MSRIIFGTWIALMVGVIAVGIAAVIGMTIGLVAGYFGGWVSTISMRFIDSLMTFPTIMLVVFSFNMVGDGLRDALDPRLRGIL
ncbi:MAG: hypothetical protein JSW12_09190 [Deltaproteobacteria bacterium]|nr:MAG: hypothetical protein JSW12_09190 [Deltaproteobacteria bacterium]